LAHPDTLPSVTNHSERAQGGQTSDNATLACGSGVKSFAVARDISVPFQFQFGSPFNAERQPFPFWELREFQSTLSHLVSVINRLDREVQNIGTESLEAFDGLAKVSFDLHRLPFLTHCCNDLA
jgi:hypothetical protein